MILEICVESLASAKAAQSGGAQRVELCSALFEGGLTPGAGLMHAVRAALRIPVYVMIRPRGGDFFYTPDEFSVMRMEIEAAKKTGVNGVVLGILHKDGRVDVERTREVVRLAEPMGVTFHRAIDWAPNITDALEDVIATGAERVLTSGGTQTALQGIENVASLVARAGQRMRIMACGRIRQGNIAEIAQRTGAIEFHASLRKKAASPATYQNKGLHLGDADVDELVRYEVMAEDVRALHDALHRQRFTAAK